MDEVKNSLKLLSISAAAKELNIGASKLQDLIENGEIGVISLPTDVSKFLLTNLYVGCKKKPDL
jgi:ribosomal protein L7Ae-like RNA K-turn-binding protein